MDARGQGAFTRHTRTTHSPESTSGKTMRSLFPGKSDLNTFAIGIREEIMDIYDIKGIYDKGYVNGSIIHKGYADFGATASDYRFGVTERSKRLIEGRAKPEGIIVVKFNHPINSEKLIVFTESDLEKFAVKRYSIDSISLNEEAEKREKKTNYGI